MLLAPTPRGDVIHAADALARSFGIAPGQRATDVAAAHADLRVAYADLGREAEALSRAAAWARRWSPLTRTDGPDGLAIDATGCARLFGGEDGLLRSMASGFGRLGFTPRLAIAPNHPAAHALARHVAGEEPVRVEADGLVGALEPLPVSALRIDPDSAALLRRLGLRSIGQLARLPRASLKKRFGARNRPRDTRDETWEDYLGRSLGASRDVLSRLDEALGRLPAPLDAERPLPPMRVLAGLPEPLLEPAAVQAALEPLLDRLLVLLERRGAGVRILLAEGFRTDGDHAGTRLRLSRPTRDGPRLLRLLAERVAEWQAEFGFDALALTAALAEPLAASQTDGLARGERLDPQALIDRLATRLGTGAVEQASLRESHVPERAEAWQPAVDGSDGAKRNAPEPAHRPHRPERLLEPPEEARVTYLMPEGSPARFVWRRTTHDVARAAGPERIAPEWWRQRGQSRARDYYRVETREGRRFWLFREGFEGDERGGQPRWFVHGLFS